jgi:hypothetical protein
MHWLMFFLFLIVRRESHSKHWMFDRLNMSKHTAVCGEAHKSLYFRYQAPASKSKGIVVMIHGMFLENVVKIKFHMLFAAGFPDNALTFHATVPDVIAAHYDVVLAVLRGYEEPWGDVRNPTSFFVTELALDLNCLVAQLRAEVRARCFARSFPLHSHQSNPGTTFSVDRTPRAISTF